MEETFSIKSLEMQIEELKEKRSEYKKSGNVGCAIFAGGALVAIFNIFIGGIILVFGLAFMLVQNSSNSAAAKMQNKYDIMIKARRNLIVKMSDEGIEYVTKDDIQAEAEKLVPVITTQDSAGKIKKQDVIFYGILLSIFAGVVILAIVLSN